jgi:hypothetical protein
MPYFYKVVLAGPQHGGKSSLLIIADQGTFDSKLPSTVGVDFVRLTHERLGGARTTSEDEKEYLQVWDCAGDTRFINYTDPHVKDSHALCLTVDLHKWGSATSDELQKDITQLNKLMSTFLESDPYLEGDSRNRFIYLIATQQDKAITAGDDILCNGQVRFLQYAHENADQILSTNIIITSATAIDPKKIVEYQGISPITLSPIQIFQKIQRDLKNARIKPQKQEKQKKPDHTPHPHKPTVTGELARIIFGFLIGLISQIIGFFVGAALGAISGPIIHNPVTCVLAAARAPDWAEWSIANIFRIYLFAPVINPLVAAFYGLQDGAIFGGKNGVTQLIQIPKNMAEPFKLRTIIAGTCLSLLIGAAVVAMVLPIIHIALPILLGVAAAGTLLAIISYESFDYFKTNSELQHFLQEKERFKQLQLDEEPRHHSKIKIITNRPVQSTASSKSNNHVIMQVNDYEKENKAGSLLSWLQLPFKPTAPSPQVHASTYEVLRPS